MRAGLNMRTLTRVISYLKEWCHTLWHILSFCYVAVLEGFCFCSGAHRRVQAASGPADLQSFACWTHPRLLDVDMEQWMWTVPHMQGPECQQYPTHDDTYQGKLCHPVSCSVSSFWGCWWEVLCSQDLQICQQLLTCCHNLIQKKRAVVA